MKYKLETGDTVEFTQKDGRKLIITFYQRGIGVKSNTLETDLKVFASNCINRKAFVAEVSAVPESNK